MSPELPRDALEAIRVPGGVDPATRLAAYIEGYPARIEEALTECYPAVRHVVGAARFRSLARRYTDTVPPRGYNLNDIGQRLASYLPADPLADELPFLTDLARLELAVWHAFHADVEASFDPTTVSHWDPERWEHAILVFRTDVLLFFTEWPIVALWDARETPLAEFDFDMTPRRRAVLIHRDGFDVVCYELSGEEGDVLAALRNRLALGCVAEQHADAHVSGQDFVVLVKRVMPLVYRIEEG